MVVGLLPSHFLTLNKSRDTIKRYWNLDSKKEIIMDSDTEYVPVSYTHLDVYKRQAITSGVVTLVVVVVTVDIINNCLVKVVYMLSYSTIAAVTIVTKK